MRFLDIGVDAWILVWVSRYETRWPYIISDVCILMYGDRYDNMMIVVTSDFIGGIYIDIVSLYMH